MPLARRDHSDGARPCGGPAAAHRPALAQVEGGFESLGPGRRDGRARAAIRACGSASRAARGIGLAAGIPVVGRRHPLGLSRAPHGGRPRAGSSPPPSMPSTATSIIQAIAPGGRTIIPPALMTYRDAIRLLGSGPDPRRRIGRRRRWRPRPGRKGSRPISARCRAVPDIAWVARLGALADPASGPAEAALPARARRQAAGRGPDRPQANEDSRPVPAIRLPHASRPSAPRPPRGLRPSMPPPSRGPGAPSNSSGCWLSAGVVADGLFLGRAAKPVGLRPVADRARRSGDPHRRHRPGGAGQGPCAPAPRPSSRRALAPGRCPRASRGRGGQCAGARALPPPRTSRPPGGGKAITASPTGRGPRR